VIDPDATFEELTRSVREADGAFAVEVPDRWQQGRGAFGGLVLATMARAVEAVVADPTRTLRTLTAELVGPAKPGPARVVVEVLRAGSGVTTAAARLVQDGEVCAHAVVAMGKPRGAYDALALEAPVLPGWEEMPVMHLGPPMAPVFTQHVEFRCAGPLPFSGVAVAETSGWVRLRRPGGRRGGEYVVAMADSWWPAMLSAETAPRPAATLTFALEVVGEVEPGEAPLAYRGRMLAGREGYAVESRELWTAGGKLVALNQQTFVVMK